MALTRQEISPKGYLYRDERVANGKLKTDALFHENPTVELKQREKTKLFMFRIVL